MMDVNGPRGRVDKPCRVVAEVLGQEPTVIEDRDSDQNNDLNELIDRTGDRVGQKIRRWLGRAPVFADVSERRATA